MKYLLLGRLSSQCRELLALDQRLVVKPSEIDFQLLLEPLQPGITAKTLGYYILCKMPSVLKFEMLLLRC